MAETEAKLLRDRITDLIRAAGRACTVETLDADAYRRALRAKLVEEANEVATANDAGLVEELADVLEVVDALADAHRFDRAAVRAMQAHKRAARGGFTRGSRLVAYD